MRPRLLLLTSLGVLGAALLAVGAWYWLSDDDVEADDPEVAVGIDGQPLADAPPTMPLADAVRYVSRVLGFEVRVPTNLPDGFRITAIGGHTGPPGVANALKMAQVGIVREAVEGGPGRAVIGIEQTAEPFAHPTEFDARVDLGVDGAAGYYQRVAFAEGYTIQGPKFGFLIIVRGDDPPGLQTMLPMLRSLVE